MVERVGSYTSCQSKVGRVISPARQLVEQPDPKKPMALRGAIGVWNCESSDRIRGCDGARLHVVRSLAGAGG